MSMVLIGRKQLDRRFNAIKKPKQTLRDLQLATVREAKLLVPRKTGHLGRSIVPGQLTTTTAVVEARANYAAFVEFGTRPHVIRPRNRRALAFATGSGRRLSGRPRKGARLVFARKVNHPGTKPQPFLIPAARKALSDASAQGIVKSWNEAA